MPLLITAILVGGLVGYLIGKPKDLGLLGLALGVPFGFIGWIIVAVMKGNRPTTEP